ncbi:MAG: tyrosine-type recombinase/integrase [Eubacteriales bacterium]|nr:tyrosine-type recombinase/integrase [Eubacteriales bacterium]
MLNQDVLKEFIFECELRRLSKRTIQGYRNANLRLFHFLETELGITELEDTHHLAIKSFIKTMTEQKLSECYINRNMICYKCYFKYCVKEGYICKNPMDKIRRQKEPIVMIETFTDDEVKKMLGAFSGSRFLDIRNQLILIMLFDTGIRNSEACDLKMDDLRVGSIEIHGKGKKTRYVPITPIINKYLIKYLRVREIYIKDKIRYQKEYLFLSQKGRRLTPEALEHILKRAGEKAKIRSTVRVSPHTCRHFFAQSQLKNGCDLYTLSKLLGHSKIDTTRRYLQSMHDEDLMDSARKTSPLGKL